MFRLLAPLLSLPRVPSVRPILQRNTFHNSIADLALTTEDAYKILGVNNKVSRKELKRVFVQKAKEWHPDLNSKPEAARMFGDINEAFKVLTQVLDSSPTTKEEGEEDADLDLNAFRDWLDKRRRQREVEEYERNQTAFKMAILAAIFLVVGQALYLALDYLPLDRSYQLAWGDKYDDMLQHFRNNRNKTKV